MEQDINKLIEELTKVRPDELSTDGLKLFEYINEIIDKNKELEEENEDLKQKLHRVCKEANKVEWETHSMIPVYLIEEEIEEYKKLLKNCNRFSDVNRIKAINERILAYKELLERRK